MSRPFRSPGQWPAYPDIPIFLDTADQRPITKSYGTTPTTPTTPEILASTRPMHLSPAHFNAPPVSPADPSPTTTIETCSQRSLVWPIPEPLPEIQQPQSLRPTLRFFPSQRPRVCLDTVATLQVPQINEKTPIHDVHPGLGIFNGPPKPPSIEISPPINEQEQSGFNFAQRIEETLWRYSASGNILKRWLLEVISWVVSLVCMAAIIGVLVHLKDQPLAKWTWAEKTGLTLNAYISILSKMAGAALILPVSEALGQLKWSWFLEHSKQMWDFEIFDNASRGPWGSLLLLIRTKGRALAALGAMIMLCSLALDPFFQQVVDFPDRWALQSTSSAIPRIVEYQPTYISTIQFGREATAQDEALRPIVNEFLFGNGTQPVLFGNGTRPDIPLSCPTSNCTWPEYETLAVCSKCTSIDVSELLTFACMETQIDWSLTTIDVISDDTIPNGTVCGYFANATSDAPMLMSGYTVSKNDNGSGFGEALLVRTLPLTGFLNKDALYGTGSIKFSNIRNPILDFLVVSAINGTESVYQRKAPRIEECVLSWCVQTIKSSYEWGNYSEEVVATVQNTTSGPFPWESYDVTDEHGVSIGTELLYTQHVRIEPPATSFYRSNQTVYDEVYAVDNMTVSTVANIFDDFFPSYYVAENSIATPTLRYWNYPAGARFRELLFNPWMVSSKSNVTKHMERLATAMTNVMRSSTSKQMTHGKAYNKENYVSVRWEWLTLPIGLLLVSLVFLAATVTKSALERDRVGVWKTSAYATLLYGLPDEMQQKITRSSSTGTPRAKAKELKVKLQPNQGWRVSGNLFSPFTPKPKVNQAPPGWI
ncbi:hypothetical protein IAQ61_011308 [Plenodomus lingam]|uniref:DUF3176 domain containing protein n=1 Tax=Leptosphaeria maculans (strain JN3 / isolate v23.1.3 / race Av1-4-5-6-7-8) TaxID=985895 RepID=E5A9N6_LEPMJ|nr:hypothetical protein LEMA_P015070.1 [Plenodomus lingam JN3]KAH9859527.1 hypothetical protein IAQ61_011308 [Plenodomus lingam]CBY00377.1 hypothetical protein LEMA_P015070.1 [Plenodomus lingam JN3]